MRRTATLLTLLAVASIYAVSSAEASGFKTGGRAQEPSPLMELSETTWRKDMLAALADADTIDLLDAELDESLLAPISRQATSSGGFRRKKSYDATNRRELQEDHDGGDDQQTPIASPTSDFSPLVTRDLRADDYTAIPTVSPLAAFDQEAPTATSPTATSPTASPTLAPLPSIDHDHGADDYTDVPTLSPLPAFERDEVEFMTGAPTEVAEGFESDSPTAAPTSPSSAGDEENGARAATRAVVVGFDVTTVVTAFVISIAVVATTNGAEAFF